MADYQPNLKSGLYELKCLKVTTKVSQNTKNESKRINFEFVPRLKYHPELSKSKFYASQNIKTISLDTEKVIYKDNELVKSLYDVLDFKPTEFTLDEVCESLEGQEVCVELSVARKGDKDYYNYENDKGNPQIKVLKITKSEFELNDEEDKDLVVEFIDPFPELEF